MKQSLKDFETSQLNFKSQQKNFILKLNFPYKNQNNLKKFWDLIWKAID
jgi:hypothetical protein